MRDDGGASVPYAERIARRLRTAAGWRRAALAFLIGAASTAALPPAHLWPLAIVAFMALYWLLEGALRPGAGFWIGWSFALGYFVTSLYWMAFALLVDAARFAWMIPFATVGFSALLAIFGGLAGWAFVRVGARGLAGALVLAVLWTAGEWLRGHVLTGFPWNLVGTVWGGVPAVMQSVALVGAYGLSLLTVAIGALAATSAGRWPGDEFSGSRRAWRGPAAAVVILAAMWGHGAWRLSGAEASNVPGIALRLVQPDVPQSLKWDPAVRERNFQALLELSRAPGFAGRTHLVWPETAVPFALLNDPPRRRAIGQATPPGGLTITGAPRVVSDAGGFRIWNSVEIVDASGALLASYDKFHLVPFGEYVPLRSFLAPLGIDKLTPGAIDFSAGRGPTTLSLPGLPAVGPLICYEIIFPGDVTDPRARPAWLVNLTNDAWFGITAGPHQHFAAARLRAIEEGLPVVRAANNGISGVIDPYGRVVAELGLGRRGALDSPLPASLPPPPYARYGDMLLAALVAITLVVGWGLRRHG